MNHYQKAITELRDARAAFQAGTLSQEEFSAVNYSHDVEFRKAGQWVKLDHSGAKEFLLAPTDAPKGKKNKRA